MLVMDGCVQVFLFVSGFDPHAGMPNISVVGQTPIAAILVYLLKQPFENYLHLNIWPGPTLPKRIKHISIPP